MKGQFMFVSQTMPALFESDNASLRSFQYLSSFPVLRAFKLDPVRF